MRLIDADRLAEYIDNCEFCAKCDEKGFLCAEKCDMPNCLTGKWKAVLDAQPTVGES